MTSKYYNKVSIIAILVSLLLMTTAPVSANTIYLPIVASAGEPEYEDISNSDGTCLFWRFNNAIYLSIYVTIPGKDLYVESSTGREDEPYVIPMYPHTLQVGVVDANGESIAGYTWEGLTRKVRCDAQFVYQ